MTTNTQTTMPKSVISKIAVIILSLIFINANAATKTWTGSISTDWNTSGNWSPSSIPTSTDIVNIPGGLVNYPIITTTVTVASLNVNSTGTGASLHVSSTFAGAGSLTIGLLDINANGSFTQTAGTVKFAGVTLDGALVVSGGIFLSTDDITINNGGTLTQTGGLIHLATNTSTSPVANMVINTGGSVIQTGGTIEVRDLQLTTNSTSTFTQNENTGTSLVSIDHDYKNSGGSFISTAGTIDFTTVSNAGGAAKFDAGINQFFNIRMDGNLHPGFDVAGVGSISVAGNWVNNNTTAHQITGTTTITFNGTGAQSIGGTTSTEFANFTVNKTSGLLTVSIFSEVDGTLNLINGIVKTTATNLLALTANGTATGASNSSFIDGPVKKTNFSTSFTFPVGDNGKYRAATIITNSGTSNSYTVEYIAGMPNDTSAKPIGITTISSTEYWNIAKTGNGNSNLTLTWDNNSGVTTPSDLRMVSWNGASWDNLSGTATGSATSGSITVNAISTFTQFTFGSSSKLNPLPVKLISFTAKAIDNSSLLNWITATEKDNDHFDVERSIDGMNFTKVGEVKGNGNTTNISKYSYTDSHIAEVAASTVYYRLKQVDFNGKVEYSNTTLVSFAKQNNVSISNVYPNPFQNDLAVNYDLPSNGNVTISLIDAQGRVVATSETSGRKGINTVEFNTADLANGIYFVNVNLSDASNTYKMIVKK